MLLSQPLLTCERHEACGAMLGAVSALHLSKMLFVVRAMTAVVTEND
jgi:hypothetical protein